MTEGKERSTAERLADKAAMCALRVIETVLVAAGDACGALLAVLPGKDAAARDARRRVVTSSPKNSPARGTLPTSPVPGRGLSAADGPPVRAAAAAPHAASTPRGGMRGTPEPATGSIPLPGAGGRESPQARARVPVAALQRGDRDTPKRTDGEASHPLVSPSVPESAPGRSAGAEHGLVEPPPASARVALAAEECGGQGTPSRIAVREGTAGPGVASPGPAQSSLSASEGLAGGAREEEPGTATPGAGPSPAIEPAGGAPESSSALPAGTRRLSGQAYRDAARKARSDQAKAARNRRGGPRPNPGYQAGGNKRMPPGAGGAA